MILCFGLIKVSMVYNWGNVTLAELLQYYNYGLANAFRLKYQKGIDISVENAYNLFVDMEH